MGNENLKQTQEKYESTLLGLANVISVGIGYKTIKGEITERRCIIVGVRKKLPLGLVRKQDVVPSTVGGISTDVVETKDIFANPPVSGDNPRTARIRPIKAGYSIGNVNITAGTFGCVVRRNNEIFILSNAHVLCQDPTSELQKTSQIVQPGPYDGGLTPNDYVGDLEDFEVVKPMFDLSECNFSRRISSGLTRTAKAFRRQSRFVALAETGEVNLVDAAIARPNQSVASDIESIGIPRAAGNVTIDMLGKYVQKSGRTTQLTEGPISQVNVTISVNYGMNGIIPKMALFKDQIIVSTEHPFSQGGDSGSAVCMKDPEHTLIGLLFAGSQDGKMTILNRIPNVFDVLGVSL